MFITLRVVKFNSMLYLSVIFTCILIIGAINSFYSDISGVSTAYCIFAPIILTISVVILDGIQAFIIRKLPSKWFDDSNKFYDASKKERKFYEFLGIKFWKDYVMELGGFTDFHKDKVSNPNDPKYLKRFILECNYGSMIHLITAFTGYLIIFVTPLKIWYMFALPVAFVNMVLNLMPMFILRYNVPRLKSLLKLANRKKNK